MTRLRTIGINALCCLLVAAVGCVTTGPSSNTTPPPDPVADTGHPAAGNTRDPAVAGKPAAPTAPQAAPPPKDAPTVTLISSGSEPRATLRLAAKEGETYEATMVMKMDLALSLNGAAMQSSIVPPIESTLAFEVTDVADNGDVRREFRYASMDAKSAPGVSPATVSAVEADLAMLQGMSGYSIVDSRGFFKEGDIVLPPQAGQKQEQLLEGVRQSMAQLTAPLPAEPVGVGGKWKVSQVVTQNGLTIEQTALYEVAQIRGQIVIADVTITQTADPQVIRNSRMPASVDFKVESYAAEGSGRTVFDLGGSLPREANMTMQMDMNAKVAAPGQSQAMNMTMNMGLAMTFESH